MMSTPLHTQKVEILSRLIKETSLTLEEALLLLKEEEQSSIITTPGYTPPMTPGNPYTNPGIGGYWYTGTTLSGGILTTTGSTATESNNTITLTN